jgi:hypothetical protein
MIRLWIALLVLALPTLALAQDDAGLDSGLASSYSYEGIDGTETYTGTVVLEGPGPFFTLTYTDTTSDGEVSETVVAQAQGDIVVAAIEGDACYTATLVRQSDGQLFGFWQDFDTGPTAMGVEHGVPQAETTSFAGVYDMVGSYANGTQYVATLTVTENAGGWYDLNYSYVSDELYAAPRPDDTGIGMVIGNVLGYAYTREDAPCGVYVMDLSDGGFEAVYVDTTPNAGTETGTRDE